MNFQVAVGKSLPIHGAAHWANKISQKRHIYSETSEK